VRLFKLFLACQKSFAEKFNVPPVNARSEVLRAVLMERPVIQHDTL